MKRGFTLIIAIFFASSFSFAQNLRDSITETDISSILGFLAADSLKGRGNFTPQLLTAAQFIGHKFEEYGLKPFPGDFNYHQPFNASSAKDIYRDEVKWNGRDLEQSQFIYLSPDIIPADKSLKDFKTITYNGSFTDSVFIAHWIDTTNTLIVWTGNASDKQQIQFDKFRHPGFAPSRSILFVSARDLPNSLAVTVNEKYRKNVLYNMIGVLPGKTKPNEVIIFSAHYDHVGSANGGGDVIFNGANDDASGVTAMLALAKYYSLRDDNERTIFFCAFAGEELGLLGSTFLASRLKPEFIKAMINIEMIGRTNTVGPNSFFLTGAKYSTLENIMARNLKKDSVTLSRDPEAGKLFQRSDNYPFAIKGVPGHSVMCSDDNDPCYHRVCDEVGGIDIANMTRVIKAIAAATQSIIDGKNSPTRISLEMLKEDR